MNPIDSSLNVPPTHSETIEHLCKTASNEMERGAHGDALHLIESALEQLSAQPDAWRLRSECLLLAGICCLELKDLTRAEGYLKNGLELNEAEAHGNPVPFYHELSLLAHKCGNTTAATSLCIKAVRALINGTVVRVRSGLVRYREYDLTPLIPCLTHLAVLHQETGKFDEAIQLLQLLRVHCERTYIFESLGPVLNELGLAYIAAGQGTRGVRRLVESVKVKARLRDTRAAKLTIENIRSILLQQPTLVADPNVEHLLSRLRSKST